ncbi:MAG: sodium-dependent transporter [Cyclobacteriaceae bacterium]
MAVRGSFSSRLGFILAAAGSAVGLGNIWKFPFEVAGGGGAAFVVMYLFFAFLLCFPVMVTEIAMGRKTGKNPIGAFGALGYGNWSFVGKLGTFCGVLILSYYNVIAGWALGYLVEMFMGNLDIGNQFGAFITSTTKVVIYTAIFMSMTTMIVGRGISGGIERAAKILMPTLLTMIICLVVYAFTLPNAFAGLEFYLVPKFENINATSMGGALRQAFFSLSLGMGTMITYGSYLSKKENIVSASAMVTLTDVIIAFIGGLMIFPIVAFNNGGDMSNLVDTVGLVFVNLPGAFANMGPVLGQVVGTFFFLLIAFAALTSTVSLLEVPVSYVVDELKIQRTKAVWLVAGVIYLVGLPSLLGNGISDFFSSAFSLPFGVESPASTDFLSLAVAVSDILLLLGGFFIVTFAAYIWKKENLVAELKCGFENYEDSFASKFLNVAISYICPILLASLFIMVLLSHFFGISII